MRPPAPDHRGFGQKRLPAPHATQTRMTANSTTKLLLVALLGLGVALAGCASPDESRTPGGDETIGGDTAGDGNLPGGTQQDAGRDTTDEPPLGDGQIGSTDCEPVHTTGSADNESLFTNGTGNDTGTMNDSMFATDATGGAGGAGGMGGSDGNMTGAGGNATGGGAPPHADTLTPDDDVCPRASDPADGGSAAGNTTTSG